MRRLATALVVVAALAALLAGTGCRRERLADAPGSEVRTETRSVPLGGAKRLDTALTVGVGELNVGAEATPSADAMDARFTFAPEGWRPEVTYSVEGTGGVGRLTVSQPEDVEPLKLRNPRNTWDVKLAAGVPTALKLVLGVGRSDIDLSGVDVTRLDLVSGIGETTLDLSGARMGDVTARIEAGVGKLTVRLPKGMGVRVVGREDGVGHFRADGFVARGNTWENPAYASGAGPRMEITLVRGLGDVTLQLEQ